MKPATLLLALLLAACGGGGSASTEPPPAVDVSTVAQADSPSALPAGWQNGAFMEIYVRGYQDSDGDGIGDLRGLISRLDYLRDLGITGLWLMPVTQSQDRDHGYAVSDYRRIEADYGSLDDFKELLSQAHARGIGVIVDYVMNHSGATNPLFLNARHAADNPYRDWYLWSSGAPSSAWNIYGSYPWYSTGTGWYFAGFWSQMPDFNLRNAQALAYHHSNLRYWLNLGVDGFRFDAVGNLIENGSSAWENQPENDAVMAAVRQVVQAYPNRYMVCEAPGQPQRFGADTVCGSAFAFSLQGDVISAAGGDNSAISTVGNYWSTAPTGMAGFLSNHDAFAGDRVWNQVDGNAAEYRLAAATNLLQGRTPFIYYGEEIGMANNGALSGDWKLRTPMSWTASNRGSGGFSTAAPFRALSANVATNNVAAQQGVSGSLHSFYKDVIALRTSRSSLMQGSYLFPAVSGKTLSFQRVLGSQTTVVVFNYGSSSATVSVAHLGSGGTLRRLWPAGEADLSIASGGTASVTLAAQSFAVFDLAAP
ncbi:MAG TPA: alpha-amylase family glycosyl hydrolase [Burkholderiaceae bacterium]|nr:alpha-amylase family glycosyl hydrolase [Burkholderiaceae bacterium]HMX09715.1 alpha-amylase family glycosyl hydrolase [Burkholderiaceae bacterium]HMY98689.1 alpha-amylase family glycosyl hydrolase [Burkholderiaceae bacterium]HNB42852.1 alpha-amylase family glycosyl hydrolase [Burkholderiaceae bacterium]HNG78592.1 alpha-amylase family glycosyl hydrolase [Burkholderiaceae bacterium]